ncbi:MAG: DUF7064 domain-containing protein [Candidatus Binatia bacterium]
MAKVVGDIQAQDEYTHPLGSETNFNESMYFNFFDQQRRMGGFVRLGNRANEGYAEMTLCVFMPNGDVLFNFKRPEIRDNAAFHAGGMRFEVVEPLVRLRTTYEGSAVYLTDATQLTDPREAFKHNPHKRVKLDLVHEGIALLYGSTGRNRKVIDPEKEFAKAHYEQHMRITGTIALDNDVIDVHAFGLRDHSWGPRYWQALKYYRWLTCSCGPGFSFMATEIVDHEGKRRESGVVVRGDSLIQVKTVAIKSEFASNNLFHQRMTIDLGLENGEALAITGVVKGFAPLRNRRAGLTTHVGEAMTEYTCGKFTGYGISEYLDQIQ